MKIGGTTAPLVVTEPWEHGLSSPAFSANDRWAQVGKRRVEGGEALGNWEIGNEEWCQSETERKGTRGKRKREDAKGSERKREEARGGGEGGNEGRWERRREGGWKGGKERWWAVGGVSRPGSGRESKHPCG